MGKIYDAVEEQIRRAMAEGQFDNLPGKGKPIDLTEWQRTPPTLRMSYGILKNAGITPPEINIKQDIATMKAQIKAETDADEKRRLINRLNALMVNYAVKMDRLQR